VTTTGRDAIAEGHRQPVNEAVEIAAAANAVVDLVNVPIAIETVVRIAAEDRTGIVRIAIVETGTVDRTVIGADIANRVDHDQTGGIVAMSVEVAIAMGVVEVGSVVRTAARRRCATPRSTATGTTSIDLHSTAVQVLSPVQKVF